MSALRKRYCIMFSSVDDSMEVLKRDTTPFDTTPFEEIANEVDCSTAELVEFSDSMKSKRVCNIPSRKLPCCATVETLSIAMTCDSKTCADTDVIISTIFGDLLKKVVRCHDIKNEEGIVCYFPPVYSTLLIDRILKNFSFFKEMQIKTITVGFCTVYNETLFDKAYEKLIRRIDILEERNLELEKSKQTLLDKIKELEEKIEGQ
ncbi:PREDICTED: uncharacterized protein LOC109585530 [Amphimedon queenslandica]|uniref:Uncharacterized protein n=1 Tax=Amphimedon queenslandica TaxID=400682 RepID=A0AAN0JKB8_AMPQE|nr:PREDICTED: uncharacterized protein LOC109585530 [Amphimedon queenslandica]|eukprot:XP_019857216.1 PREDICTED: uncharacterized protein LOC109585530 [Amphimedon queenslandica]